MEAQTPAGQLMLDAVADLKEWRPGFIPLVAIQLGSGFGELLEMVTDKNSRPYMGIPGEIAQVPGFKPVGVSGHAGNLVTGFIGKVPVAVLDGRYHRYEGHSATEVAHPVRTLVQWGAKIFIATSAVGLATRDRDFDIGRPVIVTDHINLTGDDPTAGERDELFGVTYPDMEKAYDPNLQQIMVNAFAKLHIRFSEGVLIAKLGRTYETPAETRMYGILGAHVGSMSVIHEVIAAHAMGAHALAIAGPANWCVGLTPEKIFHNRVVRQIREMAPDIRDGLQEAIPLMAAPYIKAA
ncbi:purine-nucleoside phosphorylase [Patescibacteria group bacterium]